jgi:hypothetical protein
MTFLLYDGHGPNTVDAARLEMINSMNFDYCVCQVVNLFLEQSSFSDRVSFHKNYIE